MKNISCEYFFTTSEDCDLSSEAVLDILKSLEINSLEDISLSIDALNADLELCDQEMKSIAFKNYNSYLDEININSLVVNTIPEIQNRNINLNENVLKSIDISSNLNSKLFKKYENIQTLVGSLDNLSQFNKICNLPHLVEDAITKKNLSECFKVFESIQECQNQDAALHFNPFSLIQSDIFYLERYLESELIEKLRDELSLSDSINAVVNLKRITRMSEDEIRIVFLQAKSFRIHSRISLLKIEGNSQNFGYQFIIEFLDALKSEMFDVISNYRAVFLNPINSENELPENEKNIFNSNIHLKSFSTITSTQSQEGVLIFNQNKAYLTQILSNWLIRQVYVYLEDFQSYFDAFINNYLAENKQDFVPLFNNINEIFKNLSSFLEMLQRMKVFALGLDDYICQLFEDHLRKILLDFIDKNSKDFQKSIEIDSWKEIEHPKCLEKNNTNLPNEIFNYIPLRKMSDRLNSFLEGVIIFWPSSSTSYFLSCFIKFFEKNSTILWNRFQTNCKIKSLNWKNEGSKLIKVYQKEMIPFFIGKIISIIENDENMLDYTLSYLISNEIFEHKATFIRQICQRAAGPIQTANRPIID